MYTHSHVKLQKFKIFSACLESLFSCYLSLCNGGKFYNFYNCTREESYPRNNMYLIITMRIYNFPLSTASFSRMNKFSSHKIKFLKSVSKNIFRYFKKKYLKKLLRVFDVYIVLAGFNLKIHLFLDGFKFFVN